jgi:hypothetical protein
MSEKMEKTKDDKKINQKRKKQRAIKNQIKKEEKQ